MTTISTLFSGGEGVGCGARAAGLTHLWGIEYDNDIAEVARDNGFNVLTANILDVDPVAMERPDLLHASPTCTRASVANANGKEAEIDIETATKTAQFIDVMRPDYFTLENVYPYRKFEAFGIILAALGRNGYWFNFEHLNAADFGVPQTRRRLILWASRVGLLPMMPPPVEWVGWYEAIEDLIPTLPEGKFAPWQLKRLPNKLIDSFAMRTNRLNPCAFIVDGKLNDGGSSLTGRDGDDPVMTVTTSHNNRDVKAWLMGNNANSTGGSAIYRNDDDPSFTITASHNQNGTRAWLSQGRVVRMTPRALARFQSFPDDYRLPDSNSLAVKVIGNAVPPLMYQRITEAITR